MHYTHIQAGLFFFLALLLSVMVFVNGLAKNITYVLANKVYTAPSQQNTQLITNVLSIGNKCLPHNNELVSLSGIQLFDACYVEHLPLHVITDTIQLGAFTLAQGSSRTNEINSNFCVLFGTGYTQSRLFFLSEEADLWMVSVRAKNDAPAPVKLEVWLDNNSIGNLIFDKGDNSWETRSLSIRVEPGFHNFYLWYVNDLFDPEQGLDRNAYIQYVQITR